MTRILANTNRIGILILLILIAFPVTGYSLCDVTLQWDANHPNPGGYLVYGREEGQSYDYGDPWWQGDPSFTQCVIDNLDESKTYYFVARAYVENQDGTVEVSGDSNEVRYLYRESDSSLSNGGSSSGSGSSSGELVAGCFIQSLFGLD